MFFVHGVQVTKVLRHLFISSFSNNLVVLSDAKLFLQIPDSVV